MPYRDDTDRHCPHCRGRRFHVDTSRHSYAPGAMSLTFCDACWVPEAAEPVASADDLRDAAMARMLANMGMTRTEYHEQCEVAE